MIHNYKLFVINLLTRLGIDMSTKLGDALSYFIVGVTEIFALLIITTFVIGLIRSLINPDRIKERLDKNGLFKNQLLAALLGSITPFCSCSSVPIFISFVESGIPTGVTFTFLITSPIINEAAVALLWLVFGFEIAAAYVLSGLALGIVGGFLIHVLKVEHLIEDYVKGLKLDHSFDSELRHHRMRFAWSSVTEILSKIWLYVIISLAVGSLIHGWVPAEFLASAASKDNPLAVILGVLIGIPIYTDTLSMIPLAEVLISKGVGIGTAMAFLMSATALSLPEMIILKKVMKTKLIGLFVGITGTGILLIGFAFNLFLS